MNTIGYYDVEDFWISRSWRDIPMKILGWKDIKRCKIYFNKMIAYGVLIKKGIPKDVVLKIIEYMDNKPLKHDGYTRLGIIVGRQELFN